MQIAANYKFLPPDDDSETTISPTVCFQDPCVHHHRPPPAFDSSIPLSTVPSAEPTVSKVRGVALRQSTGNSTATRTWTNEPPRHRARNCGHKLLAVLPGSTARCMWGKVLGWNPILIIWLCHQAVMWRQTQDAEEWSRRLRGKYFIKETSPVCEWEHLQHFACLQLLFSPYIHLAVRTSSDLSLHSSALLNCHSCTHYNNPSPRQQNNKMRGMLITHEKPPHFVTEPYWLKISVSFRKWKSKPVTKLEMSTKSYSWPRKY